jgi:hypothetical protein
MVRYKSQKSGYPTRRTLQQPVSLANLFVLVAVLVLDFGAKGHFKKSLRHLGPGTGELYEVIERLKINGEPYLQPGGISPGSGGQPEWVE